MSQPITRRRFLVAGASVLAVGAAALVGGTYARYVKGTTGVDSARVAKFGVSVSATGSLFESTYIDASGSNYGVATLGNGQTASVLAEDSADVIAPGTKSPSDNLKFVFSGTPEVSVKLVGAVADEMAGMGMADYAGTLALRKPKDVFLKSGTYTSANIPGLPGTLKLDTDYYPIKYTLIRIHSVYNSDTSEYASSFTTEQAVQSGTAEDVKTYIETTLPNQLGTIPPGRDLGKEIGILSLTWEWAYGGSTARVTSDGTDDLADTALALLASASTSSLVEGTDYNLAAKIAILMKVVQVD
jgi:hypothetical protein